LTEITPGRPTIFEHRDPRDEIRRPMTAAAADPQSVMNALTVMAAEQQTMNFYMTIGNRPMEPLARGLYLEIGQIEEQHVTQYESILDPSVTWFENLVWHEYNECWLYYSFMQQEPDPNVKALYELHLNMEIEHLRIAVQMLQQIEGRDAAEFLPKSIEHPMLFKENKEYVRQVLRNQVDLTANETKFVPVGKLPPDHRFHQYQRVVNAGGVPSETVIDQARAKLGQDYRLETAGPNPVSGLARDTERNGSSTDYARMAAE
jgi:rubrerythrin